MRCAIWNVGCFFELNWFRVLMTDFSHESLLRRALFEETGGMYPELITRPDIKVFLPPIGGLTVYICEYITSRDLNNLMTSNYSRKPRPYAGPE